PRTEGKQPDGKSRRPPRKLPSINNNQPTTPIQPTIGMVPIRPWMIILPNQPGSWNGHAKLSPTLVIGGIVRCAGQSGKVRPAIYHVVDTEGPPRRFHKDDRRPMRS